LKQFFIIPILSTVALLFPGVSQAQQTDASTANVKVASLPFSAGIELKNTVYVAGHLGVDLNAAVKAPPADPEEEARMVLSSVEKTLQETHMSMDDLVYVEIYCTDLKLYSAFNKVYASSFHKPYPARAFIGVDKLLFGAHYEVMGIAVRNAAQKKKPLTAQ
jgi:2-iminobutanoate/2-iminopropanoate deaminase